MSIRRKSSSETFSCIRSIMQEHRAIACWPPAEATHELTKPVTTSALYGFGFEQASAAVARSATPIPRSLCLNPVVLARSFNVMASSDQVGHYCLTAMLRFSTEIDVGTPQFANRGKSSQMMSLEDAAP